MWKSVQGENGSVKGDPLTWKSLQGENGSVKGDPLMWKRLQGEKVRMAVSGATH